MVLVELASPEAAAALAARRDRQAGTAEAELLAEFAELDRQTDENARLHRIGDLPRRAWLAAERDIEARVEAINAQLASHRQADPLDLVGGAGPGMEARYQGLPLERRRAVIDALIDRITATYEFNFVAPDGLVIAGGDLAAMAVTTEDELEPEVRRPFGSGASQGSVLTLSTYIDEVADGDTYFAEVAVVPSPVGILRSCAVSAAYATLLLSLAAVFSERIEGGRLDSFIALLLLVPGAMSTLLTRLGEHALVNQILRGVRLLVVWSAGSLYLAAVFAIAGLTAGAPRGAWLALAVASAVPAAILGIAVRRCQLR